MLFNILVGRAPASGRALLAEVRASFYRKLFLAFVAAAIVPVLALALVLARLYGERDPRGYRKRGHPPGHHREPRLPGSAAPLSARRPWTTTSSCGSVAWWRRMSTSSRAPACSRRASAISSRRACCRHGRRATCINTILLEGRPSFVGRERAGDFEYLIAATPVRLEGREAVLTIPLASRQQETEAQIDELDRRVLLAARAVHDGGRGDRLLHGRAHRRSGEPPDARHPPHRARRSRRARARHLVRRTAAAGRCLQPDGRRSPAPAPRARAHQPSRRVGRHGAAGRARHQESADADPIECRAPAPRARRPGPSARRRDRRVRVEHPRPGAAAAPDRVGVLELRRGAGAAAASTRSWASWCTKWSSPIGPALPAA